jgi:hypothetical protein
MRPTETPDQPAPTRSGTEAAAGFDAFQETD